MLDVGEQIVASYLENVRHCEFIQRNLRLKQSRGGEIDVVGINLLEKQVYLAEVAVHLTTGISYVNAKDSKPNNVQKLTEKFTRIIHYARKVFLDDEGYAKHYMLWTPIAKSAKDGAAQNQLKELEQFRENIRTELGDEIELVTNEKFQICLEQMREIARKETSALNCPVMRLFQIEEYLAAHLRKTASIL